MNLLINIRIINKIGILCFLMLFSVVLKAEEVEFTGSARSTVEVGERFELSYSVNANGSDFTLPAIKDFEVLSNVSQSSSSSIQVINGRMTSSVSYTFTVILEAIKEGSFTINPATIKIGGKPYKSNSINISVIKGSSTTQNTQRGTQQNQTSQSTAQNPTNNNIFAEININKTNVYQGEQIIATCKIYTRVNLVNFSSMKFPSYTGFWTEEIKIPEQISLKKENLKGTIYGAAELKKMVLFPQRSGTLKIEPMEVGCIIREKAQRKRSNSIFDQFFDDPFFGGYKDYNYNVKSKPINITVLPLPTNGKPANFSGAVGNFSINSEIDNNKVKSNDAVNLKVTITGSGNIKLIDNLKVNFPTDFETYDPKITDNIAVSTAGVSGKRTFSYLVIPRYAGTYKIEPITFSYFDPSKERYITLSTPEYVIEVEKGDNESAATNVTNINKEDVKYIGKDIRYIKTYPFSLKNKGIYFFGSINYFLIIIIIIVLFIAILLVSRKHIKEQGNIIQLRLKKANKMAKKRLQIANKHLKENNKEQFYEEISKALWGYLSDKLSIPLSDLSQDSIISALEVRAASKETIDEFISLINNCECARFAPLGSSDEMDQTYNESIDIISKIEKELKKA